MLHATHRRETTKEPDLNSCEILIFEHSDLKLHVLVALSLGCGVFCGIKHVGPSAIVHEINSINDKESTTVLDTH